MMSAEVWVAIFFAAVVVFLRIWCKTISYRSW